MSGFSVNLAQKVANHFFRKVPQAMTPGTYLALFVADPTDSNITANEVTGAWYARQEIPSWSAPAEDTDNVYITNSNEARFSAVTGASVTVSHYGIYDALIAGNLLDSGVLVDGNGVATPRTLNVDEVFLVKAGELKLKFK